MPVPEAPAHPRFGSPEAYTPKHLARRILTSRGAIEGERKQVTILFADIRGSLELLADRDPEEARALLDPILERLMEAVHRYEGTVNQVMGDGIMALFDAPLAHEDHAVRACHAALRMQQSVKRYAEELRRTHGVPVQIRVGLNSGEVVVRSIRNDLYMEYTAVGQTTHLAARMEQMATPGAILMAAGVLRLAEGYMRVKPLGPMTVKGLSEPVEAYELTGSAPARTGSQALTARALTRFVGRETEMEQLRRALEQARRGHGQVVAVVGEPGVGKSRLFYEFVRSSRTRDWLVLETGAASYGKATPYLPVIDLLRTYFKIAERDGHREIREKLRARLREVDPALEPALAGFLELLDVPTDDPQWSGLDPLQRRQRTLVAVKRLLLRESQFQPVLLVFEDLQWIDSETEAVLDSLIEGLPTTRILLLAAYRPEYRHAWAGKSYYSQLRIDPLSVEGAEELLRGLLGDDLALRPLKRSLVEQTQGNPFFLEESVRTLVETRAMVGERGAYRLGTNVNTIRVPPTVQSVLAARIDRLPPEDKRLLQSASVVGKDVPLGILQAIAELPEGEVRRGLRSLQAAEFLYETRPDLEYTFTHALTHDVAYGSLVQPRRQALHTRIVEAIETAHAGRLAEQVDQLAHHALRGEVWEKALTYLSQAGAKAAARSANREAVAWFEHALVALRHLPERPQTLEQAIDLRFSLRNALLQLGEQGRILDHLREAERLAETLGDRRRLGRVGASMAHYFWLTGEHDHAVEAGRRALAVATALGDFALEVTTNYYLGLAYHSLGDYRRGAEILRRNVESLASDTQHESFGTAGFHSVFARGWLVWCLAELGEFTEAVARAAEGVRIAETADEPFSLIQACLGLGGPYVRKGEFVLLEPKGTLNTGTVSNERTVADPAWL